MQEFRDVTGGFGLVTETPRGNRLLKKFPGTVAEFLASDAYTRPALQNILEKGVLELGDLLGLEASFQN